MKMGQRIWIIIIFWQVISLLKRRGNLTETLTSHLVMLSKMSLEQKQMNLEQKTRDLNKKKKTEHVTKQEIMSVGDDVEVTHPSFDGGYSHSSPFGKSPLG